MHHYFFNGLRISSEITLVPLTPCAPLTTDVNIRLGKVPTTLIDPIEHEITFMLKRHEALITLPGVGRFYISNGTDITIEQNSKCHLDDLSTFVLGVAWAALSYQRRRNLLKGTLVKLNNQVWLISGISPVGSSTFALAMEKYLNAAVISDEFCSYHHSDQQILVQPGIPALKLWQNSLDYFNYDCDQLSNVRTGLNKFWLPLCLNKREIGLSPESQLQLAGIINLQEWRSNEVAPLGLEHIKGFKALKKTYHHGFHRVYLNGQELWQQKFEDGLKLAQHCVLSTYTFKREMDSLQQSCQYLQKQIQEQKIAQ